MTLPKTRSSRVPAKATAALAMVAALIVARPDARQQPTFRSAVDLIAVDVQVINGDGDPIAQLGPEAFQVSIKGQRRQVVSANFVRQGAFGANVARENAGTVATASSDRAGVGRTLMLAFDNGTFEVGSERAPIDAMRAFLQRVEPNDRVGLAVLGAGPWIAPTIDRAPLRAALDHVVGQRQALRSAYNLHAFEIVDITSLSTSPNSFLAVARGQVASEVLREMDPVLKVQRRECPDDADCPNRIYQEGMGLATQLEREVQESLSGIELLLRRLATVPGRKSVVLVSAGVLVSDRLDGRPDPGKTAELIGQIAARANVTVYTVHYDQVSQASAGAASQRGFGSTEMSRDRALRGHWLDEFSDGAGGKRLYVPTGQGDFAFDRVLRESSGYYLLGVMPDEADRDGKPRKLSVKVSDRRLTVRSREWVVVPARMRRAS